MSTLRTPAVVSPTLIGRESQLASLTDLLTHASNGQSRIALIAGEAGIGKSRLVAEIKAIAARRGAGIVQGRCFEQDCAFPYAPLLDMLRAFCSGRTAAAVAQALGPTACELVKLLPDLAALLPDLTPSATLDPEQEKRRLFQSLTRFLWQLTTVIEPPAGLPLLVVFEDLHWCDDTSLEWLLSFARQLETQPLLVLLTYRDDEAHPALDRLLAELDRMPLVSELVLPRLTRAEVERMLRAIFQLAQPPRDEFLDALYALTEGNPFFIEEVLKALIAAGDIYREGGAWTRKPLRELQIPRTVQVAVQQRTRHLSDAAQRLLTLAAVAGQRFEFGLLQALTQHSESELLGQLKELIAAQLVVEESDETFAFRHALTRQAICAALLARERKTLQRAVAETLERGYADAPEAHASDLAYQYYEAELWAQALRWALRAASDAERLYAHSEALSHYTRAHTCAERLEQPDQLAAIDHAIGKVHRARGQFLQALEAYTRALHATTDTAPRAVLKVDMGEAYVSVADERALACLHEALDDLNPATHTKDVARATIWLGRYYHLRAQYTQAFSYLERARELIEPLDDPATLRFVYHYMAAALMFAARFAESMEWARRCIALGEAAQSLPAGAVGYWYLSNNALYLGQWQDTHDYVNRGQLIVETLTRLAGVRYMEEWVGIPAASTAYYQGDLTNGVRLARESVRLATELRDRRALLWAKRMLVMLETARGAEELAYALGEPAVRDGDELMEVAIQCWSRLALAGLYLQREEWDRATELYEQCAAMLAGTESRIVEMELGAPLAEANCAQGRLDEAARLIAETLALTQAAGARHFEAVAWRVQGQIFAARGLADDAAQAFDTAIALCEALGSRLELAHALYQRGALQRAGHDLESTRADWTRARTLCEQMGARALLWRTHAALGKLALDQQHVAEAERECTAARAIVTDLATPMRDESFREHLLRRASAQIPAGSPMFSRRAAKAEFDGLTEREREVAALVAQGKSNHQIAEALVVSTRTITAHVSNILAKLGFASRAQIARWAVEKGVVSSSSSQ